MTKVVSGAVRPPSPGEALGDVLDEHIRWMVGWNRAVFYRLEDGFDLNAASLAFTDWLVAARESEIAKQPAVERLVDLHEKMHRRAKLLLLKAAAGEAPDRDEYESVAVPFEDFCAHVRRVERAFDAAASGLDPLTGLRTRRGMMEVLEGEANRLRRTGRPFCLAMCDLDKFKSVNDTYGHDAGDKVLSQFAALLSRGIRGFDEAFRMGGEEFLVCLKEVEMGDAYRVVERLRVDLMNSLIPLGDGRELRVTASFGLVQIDLDVSLDEWLIRVDKALYEAKHRGRNRVVRVAGTRERGAPAA